MDASSQTARCLSFAELHEQRPFLIANAWDAGSARLLEAMGFPALATTSSGTALRAGQLDYGITIDTTLAAASEMAEAVAIPVSVDFEDGFAREPDQVAANIGRLAATGIAGFSIEDYTRDNSNPIFDIGFAVERVAAAADAAHSGSIPLVFTARTEVLTGRAANDDRPAAVQDAVARLVAFEQAGADVLFAPGLRTADEIAQVIEAVNKPVSVMALPGIPDVATMGRLGVARVSLAGFLTYAAMEGLRSAASEVLEHGTFNFIEGLGTIRGMVADTFK